MSKRALRRRGRRMLVLAAAAVAGVVFDRHSAFANVATWVGTTDATWATSTNWKSSARPLNGDDLLFDAASLAGGGATTVINSSSSGNYLSTAGTLTFTGSNKTWTLNARTNGTDLTLTGGVINNTNRTLTINEDLYTAPNATVTFNASGASIALGTVSLGAGSTLLKTGNNNMNLTIADPLGAATVASSGGTMTFGAFNSSNGDLTLAAYGNATSLVASGAITLGNANNLIFNGSPNATSVSIDLSQNANTLGLPTTAGKAAGTLTANGGYTRVQVNAGTANALVVNGGTFEFDSGNTGSKVYFTNNITAAGGTLSAYNPNGSTLNPFGSSTNVITLGGGTLSINNPTGNKSAPDVIQNNLVMSGNGTIALASGTHDGAQFQGSLTATAAASASALTIDLSQSDTGVTATEDTIEFASSASPGASAFTGPTIFKGASTGFGGELALNNINGGAIMGDLSISGSTASVALGHVLATGSTASFTGVNQFSTNTHITLSSGTLDLGSSTAQHIAAMSQASGNLTIASGGVFTLDGAYNISGGSFSGSGSVAASGYSLGGANIAGKLSSAAPIVVYGGTNVVSNGIANASSLTVSGGTLSLSAANTFNGNTTVQSGKISLTGAGTLNSNLLFVGDTAAHSSATLDVSALAAYTLGGSQTLAGFGSIAGTLKTATGTSIAPGVQTSSIGLLTFDNLSLVGGSVLSFDFSGSGGSTASPITAGDRLSLASALNLTGASSTNQIVLSVASGSLATGVYQLVHYGTSIAGSNLTSLFSLTGASPASYTFINDTTNRNLDLSIAASIPVSSATPAITLASTASKLFAGSSVGVSGQVSNTAAGGSNSLNYTLSSAPVSVISFGSSTGVVAAGSSTSYTGVVSANNLSYGSNTLNAIATDPSATPTSATSSALTLTKYDHATAVANGSTASTINVSFARLTQHGAAVGSTASSMSLSLGAGANVNAAGLTFTAGSANGDTGIFQGGASNSSGTVSQGASQVFSATFTSNTASTGKKSVTQTVSYADESGIAGGGSLASQSIVFNQTIDAIAEHVTQATAQTSGSAASVRSSVSSGTIALQTAGPGLYFGRTDINGSLGSSIATVAIDRSAVTNGFATPQYFLFKFASDGSDNVTGSTLATLEGDLSSFGYTYTDHSGNTDATGQASTDLTKALTLNPQYDLGIELDLSDTAVTTTATPPSYMDFDFSNYGLTAYNVAAVPEPTTIGLLTIPLVGLLARRKKCSSSK